MLDGEGDWTISFIFKSVGIGFGPETFAEFLEVSISISKIFLRVYAPRYRFWSKNLVSSFSAQDDTRHTFFLSHGYYFSSIRVLNEFFLSYLHFLTAVLHHVSDCVILGRLGKHGCPDDFKFKLLI